jgi:hypothetical protein
VVAGVSSGGRNWAKRRVSHAGAIRTFPSALRSSSIFFAVAAIAAGRGAEWGWGGAERNRLGVESRIVRALIESEAQLRLYGSTPSSDPSPRIQLPASWRNSPYMDRHRVRIRVQESSFRPVVDAGVLFRVGVRLEIARSDRQLHERDRIREGWGTRTFRGCRVAGKRA